MKKQVLTLLLVALCTASTFAIGISQKDATAIKNGKIIIGLYDHEKKESAEEAKEIDEINAVVATIVKQYWNFSQIADVMPLKAAKKAAKKDPGLFVLFPGTNSSSGKTAITRSMALLLANSKGKPLHAIDFPVVPTGINKASVAYTVMAMQNIVEQVYNKEKSSLTTLYLNMNKNIPSLKGKTLLIPDYLLDEDVTPEMVAKSYPFDHKIVSKDEYNQRILDKDTTCCYLVYAIQPAGSSFMHMLYWVDAASGAYCAKLRISSAVQIKVSPLINNSKSKSINKRILREMADLFNDYKQ